MELYADPFRYETDDVAEPATFFVLGAGLLIRIALAAWLRNPDNVGSQTRHRGFRRNHA